jgi:penicillin-binding protein 1A
MAIKKNNNTKQRYITYYQKKFWKIFFYGMGAVGFFSYSLHGDFWFDAFF